MSNSPQELTFPFLGKKPIVARFDGGNITSDAGLLLLAQADRKLTLCEQLAESIVDKRETIKVAHPLLDLLRERIYAIAQGYEDANDLDALADDAALRVACGRTLCPQERLASQPTISRLENGVDSKDLLAMGWRLAELVVSQLPRDTQEVILDVDASDDPCHGQQEFEFFNGHYDSHCYLPLYVHVSAEDGRKRLLAALLRPGNATSKTGLFGLLRRAIELLRARFSKLAITLRADAGFGEAAVIAFCAQEGIDFVVGLSTNARLKRLVAASEQSALCYYPQQQGRLYASFYYQAATWNKPYRVIARIEVQNERTDTRFIVTNLAWQRSEQVYLFYCGRGEQENRLKEIKLDLNSGRTSCHRFLANQFRLLLHQAAYVLLSLLQEALVETPLATAQIGTLRLKLLKVGAQVKQSCRVLWFHLSSAFTEQRTWHLLYERLTVT